MTDNAVNAKLQAVPHGFETKKQFINWFPQQRGDKVDKIPCSPSGTVIDPHNPKNWLTAAEASASAYALAFVFTPDDDFWFVDLDHALIYPDGPGGAPQWSELAQWALRTFHGAAVEVSHSGTGLHIFGTGAGALPREHRCKRKDFDLEIYTSWRFVALTGVQRSGSALVAFGHMLPEFMRLCQLDGERANAAEALEDYQAADIAFTGPQDDAELLRLMCASMGNAAAAFGGVHVKDLIEGNAAVLAGKWPASGRADGLPYDASAADAALMSYLGFWTGRDAPRMQRLFEQSPLWRPHKYTGKQEYRLTRILKLGCAVRKVYDKPKATVLPMPGAADAPGSPPAASSRSQAGQLDVNGQIELFAGCVYVAEHHAVLLPSGLLVKPEVFKARFGGYEFQMQYDGAKPTRSAFEAFTENRQHRFPKVDTTCFRPSKAPGEIFDDGQIRTVNVWVPPVVTMREGDVTPFLNHVAKILPVERDRHVLLTYMCALARYPGIKFQWAPVIQGAEGNGKSLLIRVLAYAVGQRYSHLPKASELSEKYNAYLENNLFIGVEEINVAEKRETLEILKDAVTNDRIEIRGMRADKRMADNFANWLFCTNHQDAVPTDKNNRRYSVFFCAQQSVEDIFRDGLTAEYFSALYDWLRDGGYEIVAWWLKNAEIVQEFNPAGICQRAPKTSSTEEAHKQSLGKIEQLILEAVEEEQPGFRDGWLSTAMVRKFLEKAGVKTPSPFKFAGIIKSLGYALVIDKTSSALNVHEGTRPRLYRRSGLSGTEDDYMQAQNYSNAPTVFHPPSV